MSSNTDAAGRARRPGPAHRWPLVVVLAVGIGLAAAPVAFDMFSKAPKGAVMIADFRPYMTPSRLAGYQHELAEIDAGVKQTDTSVADYLDGAGGRRQFNATYSDFAAFARQWPAIDSKMTELMDQVQGNLGNYRAVAALPSFRLFPWFFVIPGLLVAATALAVLLQPSCWRAGRWILVVLGVGLVVAPAVFQMFGRAPEGGRMIAAFKTIETTENVQQIQGYFGSMAVGQGAVRLEIVPALEKRGLSETRISAQFPAVTQLDADWVHILNDMTPMIGAMSDNVPNYQAVASLPPFPLFPWFFVIPGVLVAGLALGAGTRTVGAPAEPTALSEMSTNQSTLSKGAS